MSSSSLKPVQYLPEYPHQYPHVRSYPWHYDLHHSDIFHLQGYDRIPFNYHQMGIQYPYDTADPLQPNRWTNRGFSHPLLAKFKKDALNPKRGVKRRAQKSRMLSMIVLLIVLFLFFR